MGLVVFPGFEPLDAFGPYEALHALAAIYHKLELAIVGPSLEPVSTAVTNPKYNPAGSFDFGTRILPTHSYDNAPEDIDVLLIPGGVGAADPSIERAVKYVAKTYPKLKYLITVCNGAGIAAMAGVLDGKKATTNKAWFQQVADLGPKVEWVRTARYAVDGNCWTAGGVSAGIDCAMAWIAHVYGQELARTIANGMEYEWRDDRNWDPFSYMAQVQAAEK